MTLTCDDAGVPPDVHSSLFAGAGALREQYDATDWSATPLGPVAGWTPALRAALGADTEVTQLDERSLLVTGPADASTLARVSRWCEENDVLPESLTLGQRNLEDVFLKLTGRELAP